MGLWDFWDGLNQTFIFFKEIKNKKTEIKRKFHLRRPTSPICPIKSHSYRYIPFLFKYLKIFK